MLGMLQAVVMAVMLMQLVILLAPIKLELLQIKVVMVVMVVMQVKLQEKQLGFRWLTLKQPIPSVISLKIWISAMYKPVMAA